MDLKYFDDFYNSYGPANPDYSIQNISSTRINNTEANDDLAPWDDNIMPKAYHSFKNYLVPANKAKKKREASAGTLNKPPPKPSEKPKQSYQRKSIRCSTEGDKEAETLTETPAILRENLKSSSRLHSRSRKLVRSSANLPKQETPKEEKDEVIFPSSEKEQFPEGKPPETATSTRETDSEYFSNSNLNFPMSRGVSKRIHTTNSLFYFPKQRKMGLKKKESHSRNSSEHSRNPSKDDLKELLNDKTNLIVIRSFRDLHLINGGNGSGKVVTTTENDNESISQRLEALRNKLKEKPMVNRSFRDKTFDSKVDGVKTELNDFNKKITPFGRVNLDKRGKFFSDKVIVKPKEVGEDVMQNSLKQKLEILKKINRKSQSFAKSKDVKSRGSTIKSPEPSVDSRIVSHTDFCETYMRKFTEVKQALRTPYLLPIVKDKSNYIKPVKIKGY